MQELIQKPLRILSYNIHKGFTLGNRKFVLHEIRESIRECRADIICLQEVSGENRLNGNRFPDYPLATQFEFLADEVWPHFAYGKNAVYQHGHHGNAILSRFPISSFDNIDLSTNRFESRGLLHATIQPPDRKKFHVLTTHLNLLEGGRQIQLHRIFDYLKQKILASEALILAGDFNDWAESIDRQLLKQIGLGEAFLQIHGKHPKTFPSFFPQLKLDRIYFRNLVAKKAEALGGLRWRNLSDHLPLIVDFENPPT